MAITREEFHQIRDFLQEVSGIALGNDKEYLVETRLTTIMVQNGCTTFTDLYRKLRSDTGPLRNKVIDAMTTNETLWFRDDSLYSALEQDVVPWLVERAARSKVRLWSAACSTGQEPYSVAMLIDRALERKPSIPASRFEIVATDLSPSALFIAKTAHYSQLALSRGMRADFKDRYFTKQGLSYELVPKIRSMVTFRQFNLVDSFALLGKFDFILCRNVLIYFSEETKRNIYTKLASSLHPDGMLSIGSSESPRGITDAFSQALFGKAALYRLNKGPGSGNTIANRFKAA